MVLTESTEDLATVVFVYGLRFEQSTYGQLRSLRLVASRQWRHLLVTDGLHPVVILEGQQRTVDSGQVDRKPTDGCVDRNCGGSAAPRCSMRDQLKTKGQPTRLSPSIEKRQKLTGYMLPPD